MAIKKELSLKERRKIFEETVGMIQSIQKIENINVSNDVCNRKIKNLSNKQLSRCHTILAATLCCEEQTIVEGETKSSVVVNNTTDMIIKREKFNALMNSLPGNKTLKENVWKALVRGNKKAIEAITEII